MLRAASDPSQCAGLYELLGTYCHQFRNALNSLKLGLYLAKRGAGCDRPAAWSTLDPPYVALERLLDRLQAIVRPMRLTLVRVPLGMLIDDRRVRWTELLAANGRALECRASSNDEPVAFDPYQLGLALDALAEWRAAAGPAGVSVILRWGIEGSNSELEWFEPAATAGESFTRQSDELALPLLGRVTSAHGGALSVDTRDGLRIGLRWPLDATTSRA